MLRMLFIFLILLLFPNVLMADTGATELSLQTGNQPQWILSYADYFIDPTAKLNLEDILANPEKHAFSPINNDSINLGFTCANLWLRFTLKNQSDTEKWVLTLEPPTIERISIFTPSDSDGFSRQDGGLSIPASERPFPLRKHAFPITVSQGETSTLYVRLASATSLVALATILPQADLIEDDRLETGLLFLVTGVFIALALLNIILFFTLKDRNYLAFFAYIVTFGMYLSSNFGLTHVYLWPNSSYLAVTASPFWGSLSLMFGALFARIFIGMKQRYPYLNKAFLAFSAFAAFLVIWSFVSLPSANVMIAALAMLIVCGAMYGCIRQLLTPAEPIRLFWFMMTIALFGGLAFDLMTFGILDANAWVMGLGPLAFVVGGLLVFMVVAHRYVVSQSNYHHIFNSVSEAIFLFNERTGAILDMNPQACKLFGYSPMEAESIGLKGFLEPDSNGWEKICSGIAKGKDLTCEECGEEILFRTRKGELLLGETTLKQIDTAGPVRSLAVIRDVTEQRKKEALIVTQQKLEAIGMLASGVAHEVNNPLNVILNFSELIASESEPDSAVTGYSRLISSEGERISKILNNLLAFSRQEKGSLVLASIRSIVESTLALIRLVFRREMIDIQADIPDDLPLVECRPEQIKQVLMNLLNNARDALNERYSEYDENKVIRLYSKAMMFEGKTILRTTVEDRGIGISPDIRARIFNPFFSTKPHGKGTGLGLSVSFGIIKEHGGCLSVESEPGQPTRFHIDLPLPPEDTAT